MSVATRRGDSATEGMKLWKFYFYAPTMVVLRGTEHCSLLPFLSCSRNKSTENPGKKSSLSVTVLQVLVQMYFLLPASTQPMHSDQKSVSWPAVSTLPGYMPSMSSCYWANGLKAGVGTMTAQFLHHCRVQRCNRILQ